MDYLKAPFPPENALLGSGIPRVKMTQRLWLLFVPLAWSLLVQGQKYGDYDNWCGAGITTSMSARP